MSRFFLILLIFKWSIQNDSWEEPPTNFWNSSSNIYGVSKLKKLTSGSHKLSSKISSELSTILYLKFSKLGHSGSELLAVSGKKIFLLLLAKINQPCFFDF